MTMTKRDIADQMSQTLHIPTKDSVKVIENILAVLSDGLVEGDYWEMRNFGVFKTKQRAPRTGRNIHTREKVKVPAYRDVVFKPGKEMINRVAKAPVVVRPKFRKK